MEGKNDHKVIYEERKYTEEKEIRRIRIRRQ